MKSDNVYLLWAILPILPFILGFGALAVVDGSTSEVMAGLLNVQANFPLDENKQPVGTLFIKIARDLTFFNGFFTYLSVGLFHVFGCLTVIFYMGLRVLRMAPATRNRTLIVFGLSLAILVGVNFLARMDALIGGLSLAYRNVCDVLVNAQVAGQIMPEYGCKSRGISKFAWLAAVPYLFGLLAAASASAVVSGLVSDRDGNLAERIAGVTRAFHATAFVLVTSVLALVLFYKLPLLIIADESAAGLVTDYAQGITMYWGALFTVTLLAIFGPANVILNQQAIQAQLASPEEVSIDGPKFFMDPNTRAMLSKVLTTLSPLLIGSAGPFFETISNVVLGN